MHDDDSLTSIRLHQGGEEELAGEILMKNYPSPMAIEELLKSGNLITLGTDIDLCSYCKDDTQDWGRTVAEHHKGLAQLFSRYINRVDFIYIYGRNHKWYGHKCKQ